MIETEAPEATPQSVADYAYRKQYLAWVASLTAADRALLKTMNLDKPDCVRGGSGSTVSESIEDTANHGWHPGEKIEDDEPEQIPEDDLERLGCCDPDILRTLIRVLLIPDRGRTGNLKAALARLIALASALHIEGVGGKSLEYLAGKIGCTRQLLSFYVVQLRDFGGLDCYGGKSVSAREAYAVGRLWRTKPKREGPLPGIDTEKITDDAI
jgi:hypothetical protein